MVEVVVDDGFGVDAEGVVDRREQFGRMHGVALGGGGGFVGLPVDVAAFDAGAADDVRVAIRPVVAAVGAPNFELKRSWLWSSFRLRRLRTSRI